MIRLTVYTLSMRTLYSLLILVIGFIGFFTIADGVTFAADKCWFPFSDGTCWTTEPPYCADGKCTLQGGLNAAGTAVDWQVTNLPISVFVVDIVQYLLTFVTLIAVIYVIYAWFQVMTGAWDEEKSKKAKNIILYVVVGIVIMWLAYALVNWVVTAVWRTVSTDSWGKYTWSLVPEVSAAYSESDVDTFREYQNKLRIAIQDLESELKINKSVSTANIQNIKNLVQGAYDRLPDFGDAGTQNDTMKRGVDRDLDIAMKNPGSTSQVGNAISSVSAFISSAKIETVEWSINASPGEWNAPVTVSFQATGIKDPSGATPDNMSYIWWMRENGGVRRELGRGKSLVYTFSQEWSYTVFLDVISGSRNSKKKIDVLPLSTSKTIDVKPRLGEIVLLVNGVNASNLQTLKINPTIGKMWVILDATASRATGGNITETTWDFANNNTITYRWVPIVERQIFANSWDYNIRLTLKTNNGQTFTKELRLIVRNPAAVIQWEKLTGNIGDDMYFSSISYFTNANNVEYSWQIQDDNNKKIVNNLPGSTLKYRFDTIGTYIVTLTARSPNGEVDTDSRQITIESRSPVVNLDNPKPLSTESPNVLEFDASKSYDPDTMGRKWLTYTWRIDGEKINLDNVANNGAKWTLVFNSVWPHTVSLTVANAYGKVTTVERQFEVQSILSANLLITPRVAPLGTIINFIAQSENADFFEWNMGDGSPIKTGNKKIIQHIYQKTGVYEVTLTVSSAKWSESNQIKRRVYVTDTNSPFSMISVNNASSTAYYDSEACGGSGATVINRSEVTNFDGSKSINIDGGTADLTYTWSYFGKVKTTSTLSEKLSEIWCYPVKLTVRSNKNGATHASTEYISIKNIPPELTSISTSIDSSKQDSQKVLVRVNANGAIDPDGVITSYIWYYTTESDREPQNIQITQNPEITFVLPNITEKYYFGVILEDNDGAKANSMNDGSEQVPLILDNQNGNIYMPLISLTMPKNAVLVGENVFMSVDAKTIVWTVVTKNAEYAWDFDGDGRFDERSTNPSVNHTFKNSGTYQIKVRVTHNGVSNTKYATIYVKNPLKANAVGYTLADGSIYFMNTSEWLYDRAIWTVNGEQTESPYTFTIPRAQLSTLSGEDIGTLRVSNGETDTSSFTLSRKDLMQIASWTGIAYQTSPQAIDDTIHIKWQSDRLIISLLGNTTATSYAIDVDTRIDSDLDGIPDNDIDNKNHTSYTDGSTYVISDFVESRIRERTVKVTLLSNGTMIGTKDIRVILDFLPEAQSGSGEDFLLGASGSMSTFDREKLEELATMIRSTESTDRVILMQEYNTMIENWGDSFSKAKSLIDIQELVNTSTLTEDKKIAISKIIDALLVGDSASIDEVTLATKLIQDLIPATSANRETIIEKLNAISSHPSDIAKNRDLWKEILELIKNDPTIEDKYKIHIKNQLLIIINGGQASVPADAVEESGSTSTILGFISGVVWVFLYILWGILLVLLIWYVFYLIGRKNDDIGFQDFLIDSVFHARKSPNTTESGTTDTSNIIVTQAPVVAEKSPIIQVDPLASYTPPVIVTAPLEATHNWLESAPTETESSTNIPAWLQIPKTETVSDTKTETPGVEPIVTEEVSTPTWLQVDSNDGDTSSVIVPETLEDTPAAPASESTVPDWLQATEEAIAPTDTPPTESIVTEEVSSPETTREEITTSNDLPDWLVDSLKSSEETKESDTWTTTPTEKTETQPAKKKATKTKKSTTAKDTPPASGDIPEWLK